jgi:hypothetical protein
MSEPNLIQRLPRVLGPVAATAIVVGTVIGSGVFKKPHAIANAVPHSGMVALVWILGAGITASNLTITVEAFYRRAQRIDCQRGAMLLCWWQMTKRIRDLFSSQRANLFNRATNYQLSQH